MKHDQIPLENLCSTAAEARRLGHKLFFPEGLCKNGNSAPRYTSGGCLCDLCRTERNKRAAVWSKAPENAERVAANQARTRSKVLACPEKLEQARARGRAYQQRNSVAMSARAVEWQKLNPERTKHHRKTWAEKNPEVAKAAVERRNAAIRRATPPWWSEWDRFVLKEAAHLAGLRTSMTGLVWERDHLIPLQGEEASGLHCAENIQVIPRKLNTWKKNRLRLTEPGEWIKHPVRVVVRDGDDFC